MSDADQFVARTNAYVRANPLLRGVVLMSAANYLASFVLALFSNLRWDTAGYLILLSLLTWFFAVGLPVMNRAIRERLGADPRSYWGGVVELFARVVLCVQTCLHTVILTYSVVGVSGSG